MFLSYDNFLLENTNPVNLEEEKKKIVQRFIDQLEKVASGNYEVHNSGSYEDLTVNVSNNGKIQIDYHDEISDDKFYATSQTSRPTIDKDFHIEVNFIFDDQKLKQFFRQQSEKGALSTRFGLVDKTTLADTFKIEIDSSLECTSDDLYGFSWSPESDGPEILNQESYESENEDEMFKNIALTMIDELEDLGYDNGNDLRAALDEYDPEEDDEDDDKDDDDWE